MANLMFEIGEAVVHPQYGVGHVAKLEDREFEHGKIRRYYQISMSGGSIVWVPVDRTETALRRLARKSEIAHCREVLMADPTPLPQDGRIRQSDLAARLQNSTLAAQCELVRDLSAFVSHKPAYGSISGFLLAVQTALVQEWAAVQGISIADATVEISTMLQAPTET